MKYEVYIVKKFYVPIEVEADSSIEAEEKAYDIIYNNQKQYESDDTYVYVEGELNAEDYT